MRPLNLDTDNEYIRKLYSDQNAGLERILSRLEEKGRLGINVGVVEAQILKILVRLYQPKRIIECGTLFGLSTIHMARALAPDAHIFTIERDPDSAAEARRSFEEANITNQITLLIGDVADHLAKLEGPFDMIFIDHNKADYEATLDWAEKNICRGGLIVADNTLLWGEVAKPEINGGTGRASKKQLQVMRSFNRRLSDGSRYTSILVPTSEGISIAVKEF